MKYFESIWGSFITLVIMFTGLRSTSSTPILKLPIILNDGRCLHSSAAFLVNLSKLCFTKGFCCWLNLFVQKMWVQVTCALWLIDNLTILRIHLIIFVGLLSLLDYPEQFEHFFGLTLLLAKSKINIAGKSTSIWKSLWLCWSTPDFSSDMR